MRNVFKRFLGSSTAKTEPDVQGLEKIATPKVQSQEFSIQREKIIEKSFDRIEEMKIPRKLDDILEAVRFKDMFDGEDLWSAEYFFIENGRIMFLKK